MIMKKSYGKLKKTFLLALLLFSTTSLIWAQQKTVSGTVINEAGETIPGVSVVVKGTTTGVATDIDGKYTIQVADDAAILIFSFIGMTSMQVPVGDQSTIDITMIEDAIGLEDVVVVGYGTMQKKTLTGSVSAVLAEELSERPVANTTELLMGQISGLVTRQQSGLPGADAATLNIRGFGTPLILVDGIVSSLANVDPNDIESISVLKDASASIYGARAGDGVILVTTKRGSKGQAKIKYHGSTSFTQPTFLPDRVGVHKWAELLSESGLNPDDYSPYFVTYDPLSMTMNDTLNNTVYDGYDWSEALYKDWTPQTQHNLNASGGNENISYYVSAGLTDQTSNFKSGDYDYKRYNIRSNIDARINKNLSVSMDFAYRQSVLDKANFDASNMYNSLQTAKPAYPVTHLEDPDRGTYSGFLQRSPYFQTFKDFSGFVKNTTSALQGTFQIKYSLPFVEGLTVKAGLAYELINVWNKKVSKPFDVWEYDPTESTASGLWIKQGTQGGNTMNVFSSKTNELIPLFSLAYDNTFGDHHIKGVLLSETRTYNSTNLRGSRKDILSYEAPYLSFASEEGKDNSEGINQGARSSIITRLNYDYQGKYMIEFAMRADASAEYPPEGRWGYFPSVSAGWRISEESFFRNSLSSFDNLKLRASYGMLGNDAVSSYDYLTGYNITSNFYLFGSTPYPIIYSAGLANPDVTWETMTIYNIGLDATLWNGLLGFEIDAFYRLRENILTQPTEQVPSTFGASLPRTNLNKRDNRGFEIVLTHRNNVGDFSYDVAGMLSWARGKYVELQEEVSDDPEWNDRYVNEGHWDDRQWGYLNDGFFIDQAQIDNHIVDQDLSGNSTIKVGDLIYRDMNADSLIDWHDQRVIGKSGIPNIMYSLDMGVSYKGFRVNALFMGATDYTVNFSGSAAAPFSNESIPLIEHYDNRAIIANDGSGDYISNPDDFELPPVSQVGRTANTGKGSDFWTYNAAFLRMKNLNISYTLPKDLANKIGIGSCTVYLSGTNLWTISNLGIWKKSFDPEIVGQNGRDYPPVKTITFGIRLSL